MNWLKAIWDTLFGLESKSKYRYLEQFIFKKKDGWYFKDELERLNGPYFMEDQAVEALDEYCTNLEDKG